MTYCVSFEICCSVCDLLCFLVIYCSPCDILFVTVDGDAAAAIRCSSNIQRLRLMIFLFRGCSEAFRLNVMLAVIGYT